MTLIINISMISRIFILTIVLQLIVLPLWTGNKIKRPVIS